MKRIINLCSQEDPCPLRTVVPIYDETGNSEHIKVCHSRISRTCSKVPTEINIQTGHNPVQSTVEYQFSATIDHAGG